MPCRDYSEGCSTPDVETQERLDKVTRLLCELCGKIERTSNRDNTIYIKTNNELYQWWEDHKEQDRKRLAEEKKIEQQHQLKRNALRKLTKEERDALGIH